MTKQQKDTAAKTVKIPAPAPAPLNDLRISLMVLFLGTVTLDFFFETSVWVTIGAGGITGGLWAFFKEKKLMLQLISLWKTELVLAAPVIAFTAYALLEVFMQMTTEIALKGGGINAAAPPAVFVWLLWLREINSTIWPVIFGLGGGILLGFTEELFWRGFVQTRLMMVSGHGAASLISAALYGLYYFFILGPMVAVPAFLLGVAFSLLVVRSKSLLPAMLSHTVFIVLSIWIRPDVNIMF